MARFVDTFWATYADLLNHRASTFEAAFRALPVRSVTIVETGCLRDVDNWAGDGQSTILFDAYVTQDGGTVWSVDCDPCAIKAARSVCGPNCQLVLGDSIDFLQRFPGKIDFLYLDSFDVPTGDEKLSAEHHLKELEAAWDKLSPGAVVCVDDTLMSGGRLCGKGILVAEFMDARFPRLAEGYQLVWKT